MRAPYRWYHRFMAVGFLGLTLVVNFTFTSGEKRYPWADAVFWAAASLVWIGGIAWIVDKIANRGR